METQSAAKGASRRNEVEKGAVPQAEGGMIVSAAVPSALRSAISKRGGFTHNSSVDRSLAGEPNSTTALSSSSSASARLYKDPYAADLGPRESLKASPHTRASKASYGSPASSVKREWKTVAAAMTQSPPSPSVTAPLLGNSAAAASSAACSTGESPTGSSVCSGAEFNRAHKNQTSIRCPALRSNTDAFDESPAAVAASRTSNSPTAVLAEAVEVLCVELPEVSLSQTSRIASAAGGGRLEVRMRGLVALPCLHVPASSTPPSLDEKEASATSSSAHGSGDVVAGRLHAVSFRQNAITSLVVQSARSTSSPKVSPITPRSSPLRCYAHVSSLDLTHNALASIAGIDALRCLRSLRLGFNRLTSLAPLWASPYVAELDVLDVSSNALAELLSADDVHALKKHHIRIVTHPTQAHSTACAHRNNSSSGQKYMQLRVLYASNNQICEVPSAIYSFTQLADLRLNNNVINRVPDGFPARVCLPLLTRVELSMNGLPSAVVEAVAARVEGAHRFRGGSGPSAEAKTAAFSPSASRTGNSVSSEEMRKGTERCTERSRDHHLLRPAGGEEKARAPADEGTGAAASARASAPFKRKAAGSLPPTAPVITTASAQEAKHQDAVQCIAENVYSVDLNVWAAAVRRRLEELLRRSCDSDASGALSATPTCSMYELLVSLSDILSGNSCGGGATTLPRYRRRLTTTARTIASLLPCLPSCFLVYYEETQVRCPPLLLLTGVTASMAADQSELLLYEVLALHIVQNCLCMVRGATGGVSQPYARFTPSSLALHSPELSSQQACRAENSSASALCTEAPAANRASGSEPPPRRPSNPRTSRQLNFAVPLQVIHVIACPEAAVTTHNSTSALWAYLTWRQRWEAAVSRRRLPSKSFYVCELGKQPAGAHASQSLSSANQPFTAGENCNGTHETPNPAEPRSLYPFTVNTPIPRVLEWRRLNEYRPASYCAVPPAWDLLYDLLLRSSLPESTAPSQPRALAMPPPLIGVGSRVHHPRGIPVSLACVLLRAIEYPNCTGAPITFASPISPLLRWPTPGTGGSAARGAHSGTSTTTAPYAPCEDVIRSALQWRYYSQQLCNRVESEVNSVAAEQVTVCNMPLYSAEEVLQSQKKAVAALSSLGPQYTRLRGLQRRQNDVSEKPLESAAISKEAASNLPLGRSASTKPRSQALRSTSSAVTSYFAGPCASEAITTPDTTAWSHESEAIDTPAVPVGADRGSTPTAGADAAGGKADELGGIK
ncbi:leucine-rich repeat protein, putative [Leishmania panamensis]|uniref:Leucine-rich repeat protein, putative n=1 Tax=Leishmania panamensis TaxID=5679 RepID=A0A088RKJ2_LEIPA|nr:leucine-rich repeat protein, putative [Leishmania panamensis]AIN96345.1 leucine-rich repeat protein, putative [Leishmania panamensis]